MGEDNFKPFGGPGKFEVVDGVPVISDAEPDDKPQTEAELLAFWNALLKSNELVANGEVWVRPAKDTNGS